jgi:tetratricopeptide (TPR) repeat protein
MPDGRLPCQAAWLSILLFLPLAPPPASAEVVTEGDYRLLRVRACADEEVRERDSWEPEIRDYLQFASDILERSFAIRLKVVEVVEWDSDNSGQGLGDLVEELETEIPLQAADVVIGFSAQEPRRGKLSKYVALPWGLTPSFGRVSMIRAMVDDERYDLHVTVVHEIAHLFGAFHVAQQDSVMRETIQGPRTFQFDVENGKMLRLMRDYDFERGVEAIPPEVAARITQIWRRGGAALDSSPYAEALFNRGIELAAAERMGEALGLYRRSIEADDHFTQAYVTLAAALADRGEYDEALELLRRADALGWSEARQLIALTEWQRDHAEEQP